MVKIEDINPLADYTPKQVAEMLECSVQKIWKKIEQKKLIARNDNFTGKRPTYRIEGYDLQMYIAATRRKTINSKEE